MKDRLYSLGIENTLKFNKENSRLILAFGYDKKIADEASDLISNRRGSFLHNYELKSNSAFNYQAIFKHTFNGNDELRLSFAKKNYLPSMKDRYSKRFGRFEPNEALNNEKAYNYEIGYEFGIGNFRLNQAIFYSDVKDEIIAKSINQHVKQNQNIGNSRYYGYEISLNGFVGNFELGTNYTYLNAKIKNSNVLTTNTPKHKAYAFLNYNLNQNLSFSISQEAISRSFSDIGGKNGSKYEKVAGFGVTNLSLNYNYENLSLEAGISNIFDKNYAYDYGYFEDGRLFFANLRYKF